MKAKLPIQILWAISFLLISLALVPAQPVPPRGPAINPATGLPAAPGGPAINPATGLPAAPAIDPNTGLPVAQERQWIDPSWVNFGPFLDKVEYNNLPLSEVVKQLLEQFKNQFDILPMPHTFDRDWGSEIVVNLELRHVQAAEIFNAMNLVFENDHTPVRWELKTTSNGRPFALLRVLPEAAPQPKAPPGIDPTTGLPLPTAERHRMVYFVGNLLGDEKSGDMSTEQLVKTINDVWPPDLGKPDDVIQFHTEAQLLVANGTPEQLEFIHQTLAALELKAHHEKAMNPPVPNPTTKSP